MATVKMTKTGQTAIYVDESQIDQHIGLGWERAKISYGDQDMAVPYGASVDFESGGALKIGGVQVTPSAAELNELAGLPVPDAGTLERVYVHHYQTAPDAASATAVHAAMNMGTGTQAITTSITDPDVPRNVTVKGNASGITGDVVVTGTNIDDEATTDTIALNGASEVAGVIAFKSVTQIDLPVETHAHAAQVETATVVGTITGAGNASVIVTAAGMTGSPKTVSVAVEVDDTASIVAGKIRTALGADSAVTALFSVGGTGADVVLTRLAPAANDATLNIAIDNDTCTGLTAAPTSADTTAGVAYDTVSVGIGTKFGLPHIVYNAACLLLKLFDGSADSGTLAVDDDEIEKNLFTINGTPDGSKVLDLYYLA